MIIDYPDSDAPCGIVSGTGAAAPAGRATTPRLLYKYRPVTNYTGPMLAAGRLWAAKPCSLNDPFECQATLIGLATSAAEANTRHWANTIFFTGMQLEACAANGRSKYGISSRGLGVLAERLRAAQTLDEKKAILGIIYARPDGVSTLQEPTDFMDLARQTLQNVGILSLSAKPDVMLMWSHYADGHRGYCLGFERRSGTPLADDVRTSPVNYAETVPEMDLDRLLVTKSFFDCDSFGFRRVVTSLNLETESLRHVLFRKSPAWAYEDEWRHVVERGDREIPYPGPLREVIFGVKMQEPERAKIRSFLNGSADRVTFKEVVRNGEGTLDVVDVE